MLEERPNKNTQIFERRNQDRPQTNYQLRMARMSTLQYFYSEIIYDMSSKFLLQTKHGYVKRFISFSRDGRTVEHTHKHFTL